jgi:hypothetical protein
MLSLAERILGEPIPEDMVRSIKEIAMKKAETSYKN